MAALSYLTGSVTEGSADAFAVAELATALQGTGNVAFRIREILFELSAAPPNAAVNWEVALCRRTKAAMPVVTDRDVIAKWRHQNLFTTSGAQNFPMVNRLTFTEDDELLIVEDPLFLAVDSSAFALQLTAYCRIGYERVSISAVDRLTLLTQSLE